MKDTKEVKVRFSTIICIIIIVLLIAGCGLLYYFGFIQKDKKIEELENETTKMKTEIEELKDSLEATEKELSGKESKDKVNEKDEVYKAAIENQNNFIHFLIFEKDFNKKDITDKEIIEALPYSSEQNIFLNYDKYESERGFFNKASIADVEKSAKKVFGKLIDIKNAENGETIIIENDDVIVQVVSGFGTTINEMISVENPKDNEYIIEFKHISGEDCDGTYKLTVIYEDGNVIYKYLEK